MASSIAAKFSLKGRSYVVTGGAMGIGMPLFARKDHMYMYLTLNTSQVSVLQKTLPSPVATSQSSTCETRH